MNDRKQRVLLVAQRLFIEKGFAATSVQDILNESNISKGTFYNYFSSKNECLLAILAHAQEVSAARRQELLIGKDRSDKDVLAKQIAVRLEVNREHQLIPLFEAIFHSKDPELREFVIKHHMAELSWLSKRLIDVYGEQAAPYSLDCAVMFAGMIKHFSNVWAAGLKEEIDIHRLIRFVLRRMDAIISDLIQTDDQLLGDRIILPFQDRLTEGVHTYEGLLEKLSNFADSIGKDHKGMQYIEFLMEELQSESPRTILLESVIRSFVETFAGTAVEKEARELAIGICSHLATLNNESR